MPLQIHRNKSRWLISRDYSPQVTLIQRKSKNKVKATDSEMIIAIFFQYLVAPVNDSFFTF
jgi:hypothetical protein